MLDHTFDHITSHVDKDLTKVIQHLKRTSLIHTHANKQSRKSPLTNSFSSKAASPPSQSITKPQLSMPGKHDTTHKIAQNHNDANNDSSNKSHNSETSSSSSLNRKLYKPLGPRGLTGSLSRFFRAATGRPAALQPANNSSSSTTTNSKNTAANNNQDNE